MYNWLTEELPINIRKGGMALELNITGVRSIYKEQKEILFLLHKYRLCRIAYT